MIALSILRPFAKPIVALLIVLALYFTFRHYNSLQQQIGQLTEQSAEKDRQLTQIGSSLSEMNRYISQQYQILAQLQKTQSELKQQYDQRQLIIRETIANDPETQKWADQPLPDAVRQLYSSPATEKH